MAMETGKLQLEKYKYDLFIKEYMKKDSKYKGLRLGQAFHQHFALERLASQTQLKGLYELDGDKALQCIKEVFKFN
jgi:hypothetical protein